MSKRISVAFAAGAALLCAAVVATLVLGGWGRVAMAASGLRWFGKRHAILEACIQGALDEAPGEGREAAHIYCSCMFDAVRTRWSPREFGGRHEAIVKQLTREGTTGRCRREAGVVSREGAREAAPQP